MIRWLGTFFIVALAALVTLALPRRQYDLAYLVGGMFGALLLIFGIGAVVALALQRWRKREPHVVHSRLNWIALTLLVTSTLGQLGQIGQLAQTGK